MSLYKRYASREHDKDFFTQQQQEKEEQHTSTSLAIPQLHATFDNRNKKQPSDAFSVKDWLGLFPKLTFYTGYDDLIFQQVLTLVHKKSDSYSTISLSKFGVTSYDKMILDSSSRFYISVENLHDIYQSSMTRRALAVTNLKNCNRLINHGGELPELPLWDGINAGQLANSMTKLTTPEIGNKLLELGLVQPHGLNSFVVDVVYDNSSGSKNIIEDNNKLVNLLGIQSQHLFDPLLEYSPESINITYSPPMDNTVQDSELVSAIINELLTVQENYTLGLVELLQNFLIPLRITVLNSKNPTTTITKLNTIFPPTIDEITRINCILHAALQNASQYNHQEVIKAMAMFMPYFYKAYIRHEANVNGFNKNLHAFAQKNRSNILDNLNINKSAYSTREIESVVIGALLELPKLKLIIQRLKSEIKDCSEETEQYYNTIVKVIDAFGTNAITINVSKRIFTPTGKILTELATNWPKELQYGWLTRKVVGIYELKNIKSNSKFDHDVIIIFSDNVLILNIVDEDYYTNDGLSVSDILMHSLINQKPLPKYDTFPKMEVTAWSKITDIIVTTYQGTNGEYIRILNTSLNGFQTTNSNYSRNYQIKTPNITGDDVIQLITKSKILSKSQPFHLFKSRGQAKILFTAHDVEVYNHETTKSPFAIYLNMDIDVNEEFASNSDLQLLMQVSLVDEQVNVLAFDRTGTAVHTVEMINFGEYVSQTVEHTVKKVFSGFNKITRAIIGSNGDDLVYLIDQVGEPDTNPIEKKEERKIEVQKQEPVRKEERDVSVYLHGIISREPEMAPSPKRKKSFLSKLLRPFKRRKTKSGRARSASDSSTLMLESTDNDHKRTVSAGNSVLMHESAAKKDVHRRAASASNSVLKHDKPTKVKLPELYMAPSNPRVIEENIQRTMHEHASEVNTEPTSEVQTEHDPEVTVDITKSMIKPETAEIVQVKRVNGAQLVQTSPSVNTMLTKSSTSLHSTKADSEPKSSSSSQWQISVAGPKSTPAPANPTPPEPQTTRVASEPKQQPQTVPRHGMKQVDSTTLLTPRNYKRQVIPFLHEFAVSDFYSDGTPNWQVAFSRDNSHNSIAEEITAEQTVEGVGEDTEKFHNEINLLKEKQKRSVSNHSSIFSAGDMNSIARKNSRVSSGGDYYSVRRYSRVSSGESNAYSRVSSGGSTRKVSLPREESAQSITPEQYAWQLSSIMDYEFSRVEEEPTHVSLRPVRHSVISLSSDEDFYDPEFEPKSDTSSDATLTEKIDKTIPISATMRDESIAQLSALLNKSLNV